MRMKASKPPMIEADENSRKPVFIKPGKSSACREIRNLAKVAFGTQSKFSPVVARHKWERVGDDVRDARGLRDSDICFAPWEKSGACMTG